MQKKLLNNGLTVVYAGNAREYSMCLCINVGHVNEPRLGLANLFERILLFQIRGIIPVFGGTMTAYTAGGDNAEETLQKLSQIFQRAEISLELAARAKASIIQETQDTAPLTNRRMKLLYKHTAFGANLVKPTEEYLRSVETCSLEEIRQFAETYYTAANTVLVIAGPQTPSGELWQLIEQNFGNVPAGQKLPQLKSNIYTGGFGRMDVDDGITRLMFGWDIKHLTIQSSPTANVMMSMFLHRLERAYADAGIDDVSVNFKIAGYYGLRTMRASVTSRTANAKQLTDIFVAAVNRICDTEASDRRMERSRNAAMSEKLDKYEKSDNKALEIAWQLIGRGSMYNIANRINAIWETTAHDVKIVARDVFRHKNPTYIVAAPADEEAYTYDELLQMLNLNSNA